MDVHVSVPFQAWGASASVRCFGRSEFAKIPTSQAKDLETPLWRAPPPFLGDNEEVFNRTQKLGEESDSCLMSF